MSKGSDRIHKYSKISDQQESLDLSFEESDQRQAALWRRKARASIQALVHATVFSETWHSVTVVQTRFLANLAYSETLRQSGQERTKTTIWEEYNDGQIVLTELVENLSNNSKLALVLRLFADACCHRLQLELNSSKRNTASNIPSAKDLGILDSFITDTYLLVSSAMMRRELVDVLDLRMVFETIIELLNTSRTLASQAQVEPTLWQVVKYGIQLLGIVGYQLSTEEANETFVLERARQSSILKHLLMHHGSNLGKQYDDRDIIATSLFFHGLANCELWNSIDEASVSMCRESKVGLDQLLKRFCDSVKCWRNVLESPTSNMSDEESKGADVACSVLTPLKANCTTDKAILWAVTNQARVLRALK